MRDRSLDEFVGADADKSDSGDEEISGDVRDDTETPNDVDETESGDGSPVDPARSTYEWTPEGSVCAVCGETVHRRWRDEEEFVCADCKTW